MPGHRLTNHQASDASTSLVFRTVSVALLLLATACTQTDNDSTENTSPQGTSSEPTDPSSSSVAPDQDGFDDHTVSLIGDEDTFFALSRTGPGGQSVAKFVITDFSDSEQDTEAATNGSGMFWYDSAFYELHDEWFWFRLMNGQPVPGTTMTPASGQSFESIDEIYQWAELNTPELALDLRWTSSRTLGRERLYSPGFYSLALETTPRRYGVGSLIHLTTNGDDRWLLELEYTDTPSADEVAEFFERIAATVPAEIGDSLEWVVRSPAQEIVAQQMEANGRPYADRIVRYDELVEPGEVTIYNEGIAAGRLLLVGEGRADLTDARSGDILLMEHVPDWLPPGAALLTANPQTPLAHVNLLATNRGIPNASRAGLLDDPGVVQAARGRAHAVVRTSSAGLEISLISAADFELWLAKQSKTPIVVPEVDLDEAPLVVDLTEAADDVNDENDIAPWRPIIGGKSTGFFSLIGADISLPDRPLAITIRPYAEHVATLERELDAMLDSTEFRSDPRARFLLLEGAEDYAEVYPDEADARYASELADTYSPDTPLGAVLAADGFKRLIRDTPIEPSTLQALTDELSSAYGDYDPAQGLRFRSSSTVEDIEGFTGAGLYDSNTGFLDPSAAVKESDQKKTVEWALLKTWASYWSFEAFEERRGENVDHTSGAMAVLVHARFDDPLEMNNGVATISLLPTGEVVAVVNTQIDDISVTNPDSELEALPEQLEIRQSNGSTPAVTRVAPSNLADGAEVLTDLAALELFGQLLAVAELWQQRVNASLPLAERNSTLTLDLEFRTMAPGWPARNEGVEPSRVVIKQARTLDPGLRGIPDEVVALPVPRDVLARLASVLRVECADSSWYELTTDPAMSPDMGYGQQPLLIEDDAGTITERPTVDADCVTTTVLSSPAQGLISLLENSPSPLVTID